MIQIKNLFSTTVLLASLASQFYSNAMLTTKKQSVQSCKKAKFYSDKINHYNRERDEQYVTQIASQHLSNLLSDVTPDNKHEMLQKVMDVMNSDSSSMTNKVYVINGKPIGFINYYTGTPWIIANKFVIKSNAHINFLAIDDEHHRKGAGTALLKDALNDLDKRSIHTVTLTTTDYALGNYYYRAGFHIVGSSKYTGCTKFMKRLQPHPIKRISSTIYEKIFKNKE